MKARTAIIIVNYRTPWHLKQCLASVFKHSQDFHLYVVHNSPDAESIQVTDEFQTRYPEYITVFVNKENLGFVGGVNTAYALAMEHERVCFLNSDVIVTKGWLEALNSSLNNANISQVGADTNTYYSEKLFWKLIAKLSPRVYHLRYYFSPPRSAQRGFQADKFYLFPGGFCNLTRTEYFSNLGYFLDPKIAHGYWDDFDLACYLRQFGTTGTNTDAYVFHFLNASFNKLNTKRDNLKQQLSFLNCMYVMGKWKDYMQQQLGAVSQAQLVELEATPVIAAFLKYMGLIKLDPQLATYFQSEPAQDVWRELTA